MKRFLQPASRASAAATAHGADQAAAAAEQAAKRARTGAATTLAAGWNELGQGARVAYFPRQLSGMAKQTLQTLLADIPWQQRDLVIFGKSVAQPRLVALCAGPDTPPYTYSGLTLQPTPWPEVVLRIKAAVEQLHPGTTYNSCLLNLYRDGQDHVSWHSDNESLYGPTPTIASVSFGGPRDFVLRSVSDHSRKITCQLSAGDVLVMAGSTQSLWQHSLPKRKKVMQPRVNLTFRTVVAAES